MPSLLHREDIASFCRETRFGGQLSCIFAQKTVLVWSRARRNRAASGATAPSEDYVLVASASGVAAVKKVLLSRRVGADGRLRCVSIPRAAPAHEVGGRASGLIGHAGAAAQ